MYDLKVTKSELNVLLFALNNMSLVDEAQFEEDGVSIGTLYNKVYVGWKSFDDGLTD